MKRLIPYLLVLGAIILGSDTLIAQHSVGGLMVRNKYKGDRYFLDYYYEEAIKYYKLALKKEVNKDPIRLKIADSYRLLQDYENAAYWYGQVLENNPEEQNAIHKYNYANMLLATENPDEAYIWFENYNKEAPDDSRVPLKLRGLDNSEMYFIDSAITTVNVLPINTATSEIAAVPYKEGLVFLSEREQGTFVDNDYLRKEELYDIYTVSYDSMGGWGETVPFDKVLNTPYHEGPVTFYNGEDKLIFTRSNYYDKRQTTSTDGKTKLQLYYGVKTGDLWANVQPFELNDPSYSLAHPAINSTNDTLFFVSDMPGGLGGSDIYMSVYDGSWGEAINLGPGVNTEGDELFPHYVSGRLFFSSNGRDGLGGLDVYKAWIDQGTAEDAVNLGSPINSSRDDFAYFIDPATKSGFLTSNRVGGVGSDDLYSFSQNAMVLNGIAIREQDLEPLSGVRISVIEDGLVIATTITGEDGSFRFALPLGSDFSITAELEEHSFKTDVRVSTVGSRVDIDTLLIQLHEHDFFAKGLVYDVETQSVMHDVSVILTDVATQESDTVVTGLDGLYSFVIEPGKDYTIKAEKNRFTSDSLEINTYAISKGVITNDFLLEEEYIDKETVFFDYDKYDLRPEAYPVLRKVLDIIKRYPDDWVIIGAHADSRGRKEYNQELSEKRAQTVVDYFLANGVSRDKMIARGFGEGLILNRCVDGVNCREEDHSKNRRAEIVVEEKLPEEELENKGF